MSPGMDDTRPEDVLPSEILRTVWRCRDWQQGVGVPAMRREELRDAVVVLADCLGVTDPYEAA